MLEIDREKPCLRPGKRIRGVGVVVQCRCDRLHFCRSQVKLGDTLRLREYRFRHAGRKVKISCIASIPTPSSPLERKTEVGNKGVAQWPEIVLGSCFASRHGESRMDVPSES